MGVTESGDVMIEPGSGVVRLLLLQMEGDREPCLKGSSDKLEQIQKWLLP